MIKKQTLAFFILIILGGLLLFPLVLQAANHKRIAFGVLVTGQDIGGMEYQAAKEKISGLSEKIKELPIELRYGDRSWFFSADELGFSFDLDKTIQDAYLVGRRGNNLFSNSLEQIATLLAKRRIGLDYSQNNKKFLSVIKINFSEMENPAKNATLVYDRRIDDFVFLPAKPGAIFDRWNLKNQALERLSWLNPQAIEIKKIAQTPAIKEDKDNKAEIKAKEVLAAAPYKLKYGDDSWTLEKYLIVDWLNFLPSENQNEQTMDAYVSETAAQEFLSQLASTINKEPVNAKLTLKEGKVIEFTLSQSGAELKIKESGRKISQEIAKGKKEIDLIVSEKEPLVSTKTIDTLGLTSLIGNGSSDFAGSPKNRTHNIGVGAAKLNGILVKPGQEFSFNEYLGEIGPEEGYLPELVIKKNKTVPEYGGGLCQVSTTLFRAAVNSGLKITERYPHAFPVKYYNPQGFDATVYPPHPDLRFVNDTPGNILIQSKIVGTKITFEFYGTKDDRKVKIIGPTILQSNPDGSMKTVLYQEIWRDDVLKRKDSFWSNYKSPALYPIERNPLE